MSRSRHRRLTARRQVREQVADLLGAESLELALGHHGDGRGLDVLDVLAGQDDPLVGRLDGQRLVVLLADDAGDEAAVGGRDVGEGVFAGDGRAGVEDVLEDVVAVGPVRARQVGADVAAAVEEAVALAGTSG